MSELKHTPVAAATETPSPLDALAQRLMADAPEDAQVAHANETEEATPGEGLSGPDFASLGLSPLLCRALADSGYTQPTEVQALAIPAALAGSDLRAASSTGSGKTAAFLLPALERILAARGDGKRRDNQGGKGKVQGPRLLVLAPTRELAMQVAKAATTYGQHLQGLRVATVVGGVPYGYQLRALQGPLDVLIATPGRLLDHLNSGAAVLSNVQTLVLDEADRMLDMGFIDDIEAIAAATPAERQTLMFSATFAGHVGQLAERLTRDAVRIDVASHTDTHDNIEQRLHVADSLVHKNKLLDHLLSDAQVDQAVIFTSTQRDADILADRLADMGHAVAALHGGMPQGRRNRVLQALRMRHLRVLVATDVAARGIDVPTITHVINYGMPMKAEDYVHRIGRTGRAGRSGLAVTLVERRDIGMLRRIERFTTQRIAEAVIEGLEPQTRLFADKGAPRRDGKPMPGQGRRGGFGGGGFGGGFAGKREGGWGEGRGHQGDRQERGGERSFAPREDRGFAPRDERGSFGGGFGGERKRFDDRGGFDRAGFGGERKPFEGNRSFGDKPFGKKPFGGDRPQGDRGFGDRAHGKPFGDRSFGDRPFGDRPQARPGKAFGDKAFGDKAHGEHRFGDKPHAGKGGKPFGDKPFGGKPFGAKGGFKPGGKRPGFGKREG